MSECRLSDYGEDGMLCETHGLAEATDFCTVAAAALQAKMEKLQRYPFEPICLICGAPEPCMTEADLKPGDPGVPCTFDPTPRQLFDANAALQGRVEAAESETEIRGQLLDSISLYVGADNYKQAWEYVKQLVDRVEQAERERDLAIAHDRQPYPTADAYEKVCTALEAASARLEAYAKINSDFGGSLRAGQDELAGLRARVRELEERIAVLEPGARNYNRERIRAERAEQAVANEKSARAEEIRRLNESNQAWQEEVEHYKQAVWRLRESLIAEARLYETDDGQPGPLATQWGWRDMAKALRKVAARAEAKEEK